MTTRRAELPGWLVQRVGAVYMLLFVAFFLAYFLIYPIDSYAQWRALVAKPVVSIALFVFFSALLSHMWIGLRNVVFDYGQPARFRPVFAGVLVIGLEGLGIWVAWILFQTQH